MVKSAIFYVGLVCLSLALMLTTLEVGSQLLPKPLPKIIKISENKLPYFELRHSDKNIAELSFGMKPSSLPRGERGKKLAVLGDSVAYCVSLDSSDCISEKLQVSQSEYDIYNYSVPGYGLPEIQVRLDEILNSNQFDTVIYIYNVNDVIDAMPVLLSLKRDPKDRFAAYNLYENSLKGRVKQFFMDHYQSPLFIKFLYLSLKQNYLHRVEKKKERLSVRKDPVAKMLKSEVISRPGTGSDCYERSREDLIHQFSFQKTYPILEKIYSDPSKIEKLVSTFEQMYQKSKQKEVRFIVLPFYDLYFFTAGNRVLKNGFDEVFKKTRYFSKDWNSKYLSQYQKCNFYLKNDHAHFGKAGINIFSKWMLDAIHLGNKTMTSAKLGS